MRLGLPRASRQGPLGPWIAGLQGRWDEKQVNGLNELPLRSELWEVPTDPGLAFLFPAWKQNRNTE